MNTDQFYVFPRVETLHIGNSSKVSIPVTFGSIQNHCLTLLLHQINAYPASPATSVFFLSSIFYLGVPNSLAGSQ